MNRYPLPNKCIHIKDGEFIGWEFQELLARAGITDGLITSRNPQANSICECLYQTVANILRATVVATPLQNIQQTEQLTDNAVHITRCGVSRSIGVSPGALVFLHGMFLDIPIIADLLEIQAQRQVIVTPLQ